MTTDQIPIWLDCDPGTDDAFAILLLLFHPKFKVVGISTVHGNAPLETTTRNTLGLLEVMNVPEVPVYKGEAKPLMKEPFFAFYAHGDDGMWGANLPKHPKLQVKSDKSYADAMRDAILEYPNEICLLVTGAYTNASNLFEKYPEVKSKVKYIPVMGCGFGIGNVTEFAEFNLLVDPRAANNLFHDEILMNKIIVNGLNITNTAVADSKAREKLFGKPAKNVIRPLYEHILLYYYNELYADQGMDGAPLHDPLAVFNILPVLEGAEQYGFESFRKRVTVVEGGEKDGQSLFVDGSSFEEGKDEETGSIIAKTVNMDMFYDYVALALDNAEEHVEKTK